MENRVWGEVYRIRAWMNDANMHRKHPTAAGRKKPRRVQGILLVSLYMVMVVVEQGQWNMEKSVTQMAVHAVQPF